MGRTPDYKASMWAGFASAPALFAEGGERYADNVVNHYKYLRDNDLFQSHTIVNPQINRLAAASEQEEDYLYVGVVDERDDGFVVRGAKMIGTGAVLGDEIMVGTIEPLGKNDDAYAISFSVPLTAKGVKVVSRHSYELGAKSVFDYPFSKRLDENDALLVYDNVFVPWEKAFVYRNVGLSYRQWWDTPGFIHMVTQGAIRFWTKLEFLTGIAIKIAKANNSIGLPPVQASLGKLAAWTNAVKGIVLGAEANYELVPGGLDGVVQPNREMTHAYRSLGPIIYPSFVEELKTLGGGGLIQLPSSYRDLLEPEIADVVKRYVRSPGHPAEERVKLFKLAWDVLGSEFAGRHDQYERFYLGAAHVALPAGFRESNTEVYEGLARDALAGYTLEDAELEAHGEMPPVRSPNGPRAVRTGAAERPGVNSEAQLAAKKIEHVPPSLRS
jgi:4-hydroxyphenylacetate 3-monooxygenase